MFIFPMVGQSRRFFDAGYREPKYRLQIYEQSLFYWVLAGFAPCFQQERFVFIAHEDHHAQQFIHEECSKLGISEVQIVELADVTRGQAETVKLGLERAGIDLAEPITVFNIDTIRHPRAQLPGFEGADGLLEVFVGDGDHWSFAMPVPAEAQSLRGRVLRTTEKERISPLCSTGWYGFAQSGFFLEAYAQSELLGWPSLKEAYIAPMYNLLIEHGRPVEFFVTQVPNLFFSGTPDEYEALRQNPRFLNYVLHHRDYF
jgi:hypothetical protein